MADESERLPDPDKINPSDRHRPFSIAQFKRWRKDIMDNLNNLLQGFQRDIIGGQVRINLAWNAMNAVILALVRKGLISEEDIKQAGVVLVQQAQENIERAKKAAASGSTRAHAIPTPIEKIRDDVNAEIARQKAEEKE